MHPWRALLVQTYRPSRRKAGKVVGSEPEPKAEAERAEARQAALSDREIAKKTWTRVEGAGFFAGGATL